MPLHYNTPAPGMRKNPLMSFRFAVVIDQIVEAGFSEISGLDITTQVEDFREGGVNDYVHKLPKETTFSNLVLKKGLAEGSVLWDWHHDVVSGIISRRTVQIILLEDRLKMPDVPILTWSFKEAFPVKWSGPELKAEGNTIAFQTLELAHHGYYATGLERRS